MSPGPRPPRRASSRLLLVGLGVLASAAANGCSGTSSTTTTPVPPAIVVRAADATRGLRCGTGAGDVYKYVAVATSKQQPLASGVYDCFADASFIRLNVPFYETVEVDLFVYSQAAYETNKGQIATARLDRAALAGTSPTWTTQCTVTYLPDVETYASCGKPAGDAPDAGDDAATP